MTTSYHVHSHYSDGSNSILELVITAVQLGLNEIGISDHFVYPLLGRSVDWSMSIEELSSYFEDIEIARQLMGTKINIRTGLECDYEPETAEKLAGVLEKCPLDYVIGSVHFLGDFPIDESATPWDKLTELERNRIIEMYWHRIQELAESRLFDIVAHLDLYKKFGYRPTIDLREQIAEALDSIAKSKMVIEVNTAGLTKPAGEIYPSPEILQMCRDRQIPLLITSDAHTTASLTAHYDEARNILESLGYKNTVVFSNRQMQIIAKT
ncbi:MAG: histidinol-phosphatase HisJ family protein [Armatimonadota bacterium]